jgi:hypothetical protein
MGPRIVTVIKEDHKKCHLLARAVEGNSGLPWGSDEHPREETKDPARRNVIQHERKAAEQTLDWVPAASLAHAAAAKEKNRDHSRVNRMAREEKEAARSLDCPSERPRGCTSVGDLGAGGAGGGTVLPTYRRRSVMKRELLLENQESFPTPRGNDGNFGKKNLLARELGLPKDSICVKAN